MNDAGVVPMKTLGAVAAGLLLAAAIGLRPGTQLFRGFQYPSPDGKYIASFYAIGGGGAAGSLFEYVSIRRPESPLDNGTTVLQMSYASDVCLQWVDSRHLVVKYPSDAQAVSTKDTVNLDDEIHVSFQPEPSSDGEFLRDTCPGRSGRLEGVDKPWDR
jgi:hypothetical protein